MRFIGNISGLSDGFHSLVVYAQGEGWYSPEPYKSVDWKAIGSSSKIYFNVDTDIEDSVLPQVAILSPTKGVYNRSDIALDFEVSEFCSQVKYSLDGKKSVIIDGDTIITGLPEGAHNLAIYASDLAGNTK